MSIGTPFHTRTAALCRSQNWRQWSGYLVAGAYQDFVQPEYAAIRHSAALIDISPLYKYEVRGPDARALLDHVVTQDVSRLAVGQVSYTPWCDADGMIRQEGTLFRLGEDRYQLNAAEPALRWLSANRHRLEVELIDRSSGIAALALQGPHSRAVLNELGADLDGLRFFRIAEAKLAGVPVTISRTGYTGDLGYEIWLPAERAETIWDALMQAGRPWHITPCGLLALDVARLESGFVLINVDYVSAEVAHVEAQKASPYDIGLGWAVKLDKGEFIGRRALAAHERDGRPVQLVGLEITWPPLEQLYLEVGLMPDLPLLACREPVPIYGPDGRQVGRATTRVWSTTLKKYIALATVEAGCARPGGELEMEVTVLYRRRRVPAKVVKPPFLKLERMRGGTFSISE